jgi:chromosome segregation protein
MRIKRLDITGFKSFMDRSVFQFDLGITGVVGPNGCGKSNVVDAIRWVMGEQSAKNLRGRGMEDVIFNGSEAHAPLSMSEVTLTFKVDEGDILPATLAGLPEVSVTRRMFRGSNESEYAINKVACRMLDITELFLGTGVGTRAYSIIEQGRVGQIVSARPEDRRSFIEEAAGVTKYKSRRKAAERKMESTQANLLRVNDIVQELERRLDSLERQAKKAEKYKKLKSEMRELELHVQSHRWLELQAQKKVLELQLSNLSNEERESYGRVQQLEGEIEARRTAIDTEGQALERAAVELAALEGQEKLDAQNLGHWRTDADSTRARLSKLEADAQATAARETELQQALSAREAELGSLAVASKEDEVALQVSEEEIRRVSQLSVDVAGRLERERKELTDVVTRVANHETHLADLLQRRGELEQRRARHQGEVETLRAEEAQLEAARAEVLDRVGVSRQSAQDLATRRTDEESELTRTREEFAENEIQVICLREELADKRSRFNSLQEIARNYEGYDRGVRAVMLKAGAEPKALGVFGPVSDVVTAPPQYEKAIEAALGERLQHVIVETPEKGFELVEYLNNLSEGRSTFLPVVTSGGAAAEVGVTLPGPRAIEVVTVAEEVLRPVVELLLRDVVVVPELSVAREQAALLPAVTFVTLAGEVLRPGGVVTGGVLEGPAVGALQKRREIGELELQVKQLEERYNEIVTRHYELQKQMGHREGVLKGLAKNQHAEEISLATHEKDLVQAGQGLVKLRERIGVVTHEAAQLTESLRILESDEESSRGELAHGQTDRDARDERVRLLGGELESLKGRSESFSQQLTEVKVRVASASEKGDAARQAVEQLKTQVSEVAERAQALGLEREESSGHLELLSMQIDETAERQAARSAQLTSAREDLTTRRTAHNDTSAKVREDEATLKELRTRLDGVTHGLSEISIKDRELSLERDHLVATVRERHAIEIGDAVYQYHLLPQPTAEAESRMKDLRGQVERMGEVNLTAIEEHTELRTRFDFLSKQKSDLEASLAQLEEAIVKIDRTSRERFKQTFDAVNEKFQQIYPRLFGGGRAQLMLTQEGVGQEAGVEIVAQPPGKKLQSVNLLSGGEKALTAVSMIFAIFLIKPTPFCLLDEVDAPLDEGNVGRYNDMVREMSKQSQFILITHNKRTMEVVDTLYGVTMEEPGVSKLVSVKMSEAAAANSDQQVA